MRRDPMAPTWDPKVGDRPHATPSLPQQHGAAAGEWSAGGASCGASCAWEQILPLLTAGERQLPPSSSSSPLPSESPTSPAPHPSFIPAKCRRSRCLPSTYWGERPAHPTPPLATKPPAPYNTDFQDRGRKRCFPQGVLQNSWEWMSGNLEGL